MARLLRVVVLCGCLVALTGGVASASSSQQSLFQDNGVLLNNQTNLPQTLTTLRSLGVNRLRVSVVWNWIAPDGNALHAPRFNASNPAAYPAGNWAAYDNLVTQAATYGLKLDFDIIGGAPRWATPTAPAARLQSMWYPSASDFGQFVTAVGKRYSGNYTPPGASAPLPRVSFWSIWNEPNVGTSGLSPQTIDGQLEVGPRLYRGLANAAFRSLVATGHTPSRDTILVGEMASTGHADPGIDLAMQPLRFLRTLYCVDSNNHPFRGRAAGARGCPTTAAAARSFRANNPALFEATGWGHHPYDLSTAPNTPVPAGDPDWLTLANLSKLTHELDYLQSLYGSSKHFSLYLDEYGYDSNPPQTVNSVSLQTQAKYLNQAEYIAWRNNRVQSMAQYLLRDHSGVLSPWSSDAGGLEFASGQHKPAFDAYRLPIWMPTTTARRGSRLEVWGCIRPSHYAIADTGHAQTARILFTPSHGGRVVSVATAKVTNPNDCYFDLRVKFPASGTVTLSYTYPGGDPLLPHITVQSRKVKITLR